jgi:nucleoside-diphosphate-sugar epimerase
VKYKIGLTGATGSLGKIIIKNNKKNFNIVRFNGDITDRIAVLNWVLNNDLKVILHLAAVVPIKLVNKNKNKAKDTNYNGTKNIVDAAILNKVKWFFFSSTSHVYKSSKIKISENFKKEPISYYGKTKLLAENYLIKKFTQNKIRYCIGRIFSTANKSQKKNYLIPDLKVKIRKFKKFIKLKNLNHFRDFISMEDISRIIFYLYEKKIHGIINLGTGKAIYLKKIAMIIAKKYNKKIIFEDNKYATYLIADNRKLKKIYKKNINKKIERLIF